MLVLKAPLTGWAGPLDEAPDPVFAGRLLGDGLAIDPVEGVLHAPCDGEVASTARTAHAVTLRAGNGAEILMHVGLETVALAGEGFHLLVAEGQAVSAGEPLLRFDLDLLAERARSLLTPVVIANGDAFEIVRRAPAGRVSVGDDLLELRPRHAAEPAPGAASPGRSVRALRTGLAHGLHARPAALIAQAARKAEARITLSAHGRTADARSVTALMTLGLRTDDRVSVTAEGVDADEALAAIVERLQPRNDVEHDQLAAPPPGSLAEPTHVKGVRASGGLAIGTAARLDSHDLAVPERAADAAAETATLDRARADVGERLRSASASGGPQGEIAAAHAALLDDPVLVEAAAARIASGSSAAAAWRSALRAQAAALAALDDPRLRGRQADLLDVERQVIAACLGRRPTPDAPPAGSILLADELLPSELAALSAAGLAGVAMERGGPTAHVAIIAASLGLPMLVACGPALARVEAGAPLILDADAGVLHVRPPQAEIDRAAGLKARRAHRRTAARAHAAEPCLTRDGVRIEVFANIGAPAETAQAVAEGAEGCGLLRTEFLFQDRATAPSEDEQLDAYRAVAEGLAGRPLIVRTLDIGADKPAPYLKLGAEQNPALGMRGVRIGLAQPELLRTQLRAILRLQAPAVRILLPMVSTLAELERVRDMLGEEAQRLGARPPPLGAMVETPAAAVTAATLAREAAFFSIGTNDLTQYALAMDRTEPQLAAQLDGLHPAVLGLIAQATAGAESRDRPVGVCGGLASEPAAAPFLIGLGVRELSAEPARVAEVKAAVRTLDLAACRDAAQAALSLPAAEAVRALAAERWPDLVDA